MMVGSRQSFEAWGRELLSTATPALEKFFGWMEKFGNWARENKQFINDTLLVIASGVALIGAAAIPINLTVAAIVALGVGIAALMDDFQTWQSGGNAAFPWADWVPHIKTLVEWLEKLREVGYNVFTKVFGGIDALVSGMRGDRTGQQAAYAASSGWQSFSGGGTPSAGSPQAKLASLEQKYNLPRGLLDSVWSAESGRGKNMRSPAGAMGHFQFMPGTASEYGLSNPDNFDQSADAAARYYRDLIARYGGDVNKAVAAYNWGMGNVDRKGMGAMPSETQGYLAKVLGGMPGAASLAAGAGAGMSSPVMGGGNRTVETHIENLTITTQATDAAGMARDAKASLNYLFAPQANAGLM
jgi:hypothetical protein